VLTNAAQCRHSRPSQSADEQLATAQKRVFLIEFLVCCLLKKLLHYVDFIAQSVQYKENIMTIITICGDPFKQESEITYIAERMTCSGEYCVLTPVVPFIKKPGNLGYTPAEIGNINEVHRKKIKLSDAILVMDTNANDAEKYWIEYAKRHQKQVLYYSQEIHNWR